MLSNNKPKTRRVFSLFDSKIFFLVFLPTYLKDEFDKNFMYYSDLPNRKKKIIHGDYSAEVENFVYLIYRSMNVYSFGLEKIMNLTKFVSS